MELTSQSRLSFGKYKDRLVKDILKIDPKYLKFLKDNNFVKFNTYLTQVLK